MLAKKHGRWCEALSAACRAVNLMDWRRISRLLAPSPRPLSSNALCLRYPDRTEIAVGKLKSSQTTALEIQLLAQLIILVAVAASQDAIPKQFNLECSGTVSVSSLIRSLAPATATEWKETFRINLSDSRWCDGRCEVVNKIARADSDNLMLRDDQQSGRIVRTWINRRTGRYYSSQDLSPYDAAITSGQCVVSTFTDFTPPQF